MPKPLSKTWLQPAEAPNDHVSSTAAFAENETTAAETAKANNLKPYEYFEYLLTQILEHMVDTDRSFLEDLLPWSPKLPEYIRKQKDRC